MILNYAANKKNIEVIIDANNMSNLMLHADLAIGAGGSSSWERCCLGLPSLVYVLAENQRPIAQNLEQLGAVKMVDNLVDNLNNILNEFSIWQYMSMKAQSICDGRGVKRINI
jgi:UDP-2,4-diacetamido-2,4,6-trideoxy-beta-L-altropyranose hydrolase